MTSTPFEHRTRSRATRPAPKPERRGAPLLALATLFLLLGCPGDDEPPSEEEGTSAANEEATGGAQGGGGAEPADGDDAGSEPGGEPIDPDRARKLLERWVHAQNDGDFDTYAELYAPRFEGVKRTEDRASRFARKGWLRHRRGTFDESLEVKVKGLDVTTGPRTAVISFEQHGSLPSFADKAPKQMVLVKRNDALRIAREEVLGHGRKGSSGPPQQEVEEEFLFVVEAGTPHVVLHRRPETAWARGAPELVSRDSPVVVRRPVRTDALPEPAREATGRIVRLYAAEGRACAGQLGEPSLVRRVVPHFGTRAHWKGRYGGEGLTEAEIARDAWQLAAGTELLVAPVEPAEGKCESALWGRWADRPAPTVYRRAKSAAETRIEALKRFRALPAHQRLERRFRRQTSAGDVSHWDQYGDARPRVSLWRAPKSERAFVVVAARAGPDCGNFEGALWAVFERHAGGRLTLLGERDDTGYARPLAVFDLQGDGQIEVLGDGDPFVDQRALLRYGADGFTRAATIQPLFLDCTC